MLFKKKSYEVICVGSVSKDVFLPTDEGLIIKTPEDLTSKQKVAFDLGGKYRIADRYEAVGGVAANVAHGLTRLGHHAGCYSKKGGDDIGEWIESEFKREKVPTEFLYTDMEAKSDLSAIIVLTQNGERTIFHNRDANEKLEIIDNRFSHTQWVFISALNGDWQGNLKKLLVAKERYGFSVALNPGQHNIKEDTGLMLEALKQTDILLLNKEEAIAIIRKTQAIDKEEHLDDELFLLRELFSAGAALIGMTDGKRGAWAFDGKEYWYCPIHTVTTVVDSTGAGDAFGSGFFSALLEGKSLSQALSFGIANSGSVVGAYGAIAGLLSKDQMRDIVAGTTPERLR